jgi:HEAT repeat protein
MNYAEAVSGRFFHRATGHRFRRSSLLNYGMTSTEQRVGVFTTDEHLVIRSWDEWLASVTGVAAERARGQRLPELFPEIEGRGFTKRFERVLSEGVVEVLATAFHHYLIACAPLAPSKRFDRMQQRVTIAPLREAGAVVGTLVTIEDVTARIDHERDLAEQMASPDEAVRLRAAEALAEEEERTSARNLMGALGDDSWRVRRIAVNGLAKQAGGGEVTDLLRALREEHHNPGVLNSALQVLALSGVDAIIPLTEFLNDADADLRIYATLALGEQHDPRAIPALIRALDDQNANVRFHAIDALSQLRATDAVDALVAIAESRDFFLAFPALDALAAIGDKRIAPRLVPLLEDELLRSPAADALGQLGDGEVVAPLAALLNTEGAPTCVIAQSLAALCNRYQQAYQEGAYIADLARNAINATGVQNLISAIDSANGEGLRDLVVVLGWLEGERIERALVPLLGEATARKEVVEALVRYGERVTGLLIEQLDAEDAETRKAAIIALGRIGDARAVPALVATMAAYTDLIIPAAGALGKIGDRRAFEALLDLISHEDAAVRQAAISAINSLGHPDMAARAVLLLNDGNPYVRESAVRIAGYFGYEQCADLLLARCRDEEENVRRAAIEHIPYIEDERVLGVLAAALENETPRVRAAAASAFAQIESALALPYLLKGLNDSDAWVRYFAARAIGQHGYSESLDALIKLAQTDGARQVRIAAVDALGEIGGPRAVAVLVSLFEATEPDLMGAALQALGHIGHTDALPPLLEALRSTDQARRLKALQALGERGGEGVADTLQWVAAADTDAMVAQAAIEALTRLATPEAINALITLTADGARRADSITALVHLGERNLEAIGRGINHPQASVRRAVVEALGRMKSPLASELLMQALDDSEASIRLAAVSALGYLGSRTAEKRLVMLAHTDKDAAVRRAAQRTLRR